MSQHSPVETEIGTNESALVRLRLFIQAREVARQNHDRGEKVCVASSVATKFQTTAKLGYSSDPIIAEYRFCNVRREDDRVTVWLRKNWREPHIQDTHLWFAMCVARFVNWPDTLDELGYPVPWDASRFLFVMRHRKLLKAKVYSGAYMTRAEPGMPGEDKASYQAKSVFGPLWENRMTLRPSPEDTLNSYHTMLMRYHGMGSFMAAQVVADMKYAPPFKVGREVRAKDWWTFAASGPGSRRGLNRVLGRPPESPWTEEGWRMEHSRLIERMGEIEGVGRLTASDWQNVECEFDKYERVRLGEGRPRARYTSHG